MVDAARETPAPLQVMRGRWSHDETRVCQGSAEAEVPRRRGMGGIGYDPRGGIQMSTSQAVIRVDHEILSGTPCFAGTHVPVETLMDFLKAGDRLADFLDDSPSVTRDQVDVVLETAGEAVTRHARTA